MFRTRILESGDADRVASIHKRAFKDFFLTNLGMDFLSRFYKALTQRKDTVCRGYWNDRGQLVGFFVANYSHKGFYKSLAASNCFPFFASTFLTFLRNPRLLLRLAHSFRSNSQSHGFENYPYLLSICVDPLLQNKGLGKMMIHDLVKILENEGHKGVHLTTDSKGNNSINSFYIRTGFVKRATISQGSRQMNVYFREFGHH